MPLITMPNITEKLRDYMQRRDFLITEGMLSDTERKNNEARITKILKKSLIDLVEIVAYSDKKRIEKTFKPEYIGILQYLIAKLSLELDEEFRDNIRVGLEAGYYVNSPGKSITQIPVTTSSHFKGFSDKVALSKEERDLQEESPYKFESTLDNLKIPRFEIGRNKKIYNYNR